MLLFTLLQDYKQHHLYNAIYNCWWVCSVNDVGKQPVLSTYNKQLRNIDKEKSVHKLKQTSIQAQLILILI